MNSKKTIALIIGKGKDMLGSDMIDGVINQAKILGYNVAVLSVFALSDVETKFQYGENNIYSLLDCECIEGVVFVDYSVSMPFSKEKVLKHLERFPKDRVVVMDDDDMYGYKGVASSDKDNMEKITDHLIERHNCKDILCLAGPYDNNVSIDRLEGFKASLTKHGLKINPDRIIEGDFWVNAATRLADQIINGEIAMPDGIVVCNYKMTNVLITELTAGGIVVPRDFPVVGYDYTEVDAINLDVNPTTFMRPDRNLGARCVCYLHKSITGEEVEPYIEDKGRLIVADSCGCRNKSPFYKKSRDNYRINMEFAENFRMNFMQEDLLASDNIDEFLGKIRSYFYYIRNLRSYNLCLNENWNMYSENDSFKIVDGYAEKMINIYSYYNENGHHSHNTFKTKDLFPNTLRESDEPIVGFITPVHFENRCFGYQVTQFINDHYNTSEDIYHSWSGSISIALEYMRMKDHMNLLYNKVYAASIRDNMTGLYNRRGYDRFKQEMFEKSLKEHEKLLIMSVDMNNLKLINDTYGHIEGDNAITVLSAAINTCCSNNEYACRMGGDEFIIIGSGDYSQDIPGFYKERIRNYLSRYNSSSKKTYEVSASIGYFLGYADDYKDINECENIADESMYRAKAISKMGR